MQDAILLITGWYPIRMFLNAKKNATPMTNAKSVLDSWTLVATLNFCVIKLGQIVRPKIAPEEIAIPPNNSDHTIRPRSIHFIG